MATRENVKTAPIVVGVDASESNVSALRWGADEAARAGSPLRLAYVINKSLLNSPHYSTAELDLYVKTLMARARVVVEQEYPDVAVQIEVVTGSPRSELVNISRRAAMLVVGRRGQGSFRELLLGSVAVAVAAHSTVPTAVIPHLWDLATPNAGPIVIGVDESGVSDEAMRLACELARQRDVPLHAVQVIPAGEEFLRLQTYDVDSAGHHAAALEVLETATARWREQYPDVTFTCRPEWGHPVRALVDASVSAQALVLGGSRHSRLSAAFLGSVQQGVLHHAHCPVILVHGEAG